MRSSSPLARPRFAVLVVGVTSLLRCSGSAEPKGPDHACFRALDCQDGLVCIEGRCTADLTPIVPEAAAAPPSEPRADAGPE